jgi:hypothetical protein
MAISMIEFLLIIVFGGWPVVVLLVGLLAVIGDFGGGIGKHPDRF